MLAANVIERYGDALYDALRSGVPIPKISSLEPDSTIDDAYRIQSRLVERRVRAGETITAFIARVSQGDVAHAGAGFRSIFAAGMTLFVMTLALNILGHYLRKRFRQTY